MVKNDFVLLSGRANPSLAKAIGKKLGITVTEPVGVFSDGEIRVRIEPNLRRKIVFIIQPTSTPVNDHLMELLFMIDAAKRSSASEVNVVMPYFGYARQDRKELPRVPISSSVVTSLLTSTGADRILTIDIHSEQQEGFTQKPWDNLYGSYSLIPAIKKRKLKDLVVAAPDKNGMLRATAYAKLLGAKDVALVYKERDVKLNNVSGALNMIGEADGRDVLIVDDMIDTGGTIAHAANFLKKRGAKTVRVAATHGLFSGEALSKIQESEIKEVLITNSIAQREEVFKHPKVTIVSIADLLAEAIRRIRTGESISRDLIL
jgi:ribose-phosphate pyrophosphokinase